MVGLLEKLDVLGEYFQCSWYSEIAAFGDYQVLPGGPVLEGTYVEDKEKPYCVEFDQQRRVAGIFWTEQC